MTRTNAGKLPPKKLRADHPRHPSTMAGGQPDSEPDSSEPETETEPDGDVLETGISWNVVELHVSSGSETRRRSRVGLVVRTGSQVKRYRLTSSKDPEEAKLIVKMVQTVSS